MIFRLLTQNKGNATLEFALSLPLLIGVLLISADLYNINRISGVFEQSAHNLASILSRQKELTKNGFDHLVDSVLPVDTLGDYSLVVSKVNLDRSMDWKPLYRGELEDICTPTYEDGTYIGEIPEENEDVSNQSFIVIQLCRMSEGLTLNSGLLGNKLIESISVNRMARYSIKLDQDLSKEVGLEDESGY